ncbi:nucleoside-triphosphatase [Enterococcus sp. HY326]|uniref:nucleoside-triphosphatase n=1 Tax=Enterococcus sp. HY326 TaxID=2971265 RepID=UPI0022406EB4|nr:nucleoside-triphosphatase [Enterococcus sp. HY326]
MANFFLEGPKFSGKSTLLQTLLQTNGAFSGFYVERWLDNRGQIVAFELRDAAFLQAALPPIPEHFFIIRQPQPQWQTAVFEKFGCRLLEQAQASENLILLDEIGGIELLAPNFMKQLLAILQGSQKIVGVFKSEKNYQEQRQRLAIPSELDEKRATVKEAIQKQGQIHHFDSETAAKVNAKLIDFLA